MHTKKWRKLATSVLNFVVALTTRSCGNSKALAVQLLFCFYPNK
jgi:hypothetical protein